MESGDPKFWLKITTAFRLNQDPGAGFAMADGLDDRVGGRSTLITSQLPLDHWHDYIGDPTLADAILDRLMHNAHKIHLEGEESMRKRAGTIDQKPTSKAKKVD